MPFRILPLWSAGVFTAGVMAAAVLAGPCAAGAEQQLLRGPAVEHRQRVGGRAEVEIRMDRGKLVVRGGAAGEARVSGRLGADVAGLQLKQEGNWLRYEVKPKESAPGTFLALDSELTLDLPAGSDLIIEAPAVEVQIEGIGGKIDVRTLSGPVRLAGSPARVEVQTISGPISTAADFSCPVTVLRSVAGKVELNGKFEELNARTADSQLRMTGAVSDEALLESGNGTVSFEGEIGPVARLRVQTMGGEARLLLPRSLEGHFLATSFEGELENGLGPAFSRPGLRRTSQWQAGKAARRIEVETFHGKISMLPR